MQPDQIWQTALSQLQMQMTRATFDTWVRPTNVLSYEDGVLTIGVHNSYAKDWLENRLRALVGRTLADIVGHEVQTCFVVQAGTCEEGSGDEAPPQSDAGEILAQAGGTAAPARFRLPEYNTEDAGWFKVTRYEDLFWAPLLGRVAWRVREICLEADTRRDKSDNWTPSKRWTAPHLADLVPCGKQAVTGVNRKNGDGNLHYHAGAFDRLIAYGAARVNKQGTEPHIIYVVSVMIRLPLLRPEQIKALPDRLQVRHDHWLEEHGFDAREWFAQDSALLV